MSSFLSSSRLSITDMTDLLKPKPFIADHVIIDASVLSDGLQLAKAGGFLTHKGGDFYLCKRTVANNLSLTIISDWPGIVK